MKIYTKLIHKMSNEIVWVVKGGKEHSENTTNKDVWTETHEEEMMK